jgi:hypothetical protein
MEIIIVIERVIKIRCADVDWIHLAVDTNQCRALVNTKEISCSTNS